MPEIDDMDLETGAVARDARGVTVNEYMQSVSNPAVYAAGDAVASGGFPLTPVAGMQGAIVASNLLKGNHRMPDYRGIPSVVFMVPPLASVGFQEAVAREQGLRFRTNYQDTASWYTSRRVGLQHSGFKVLIEEETERILGAHLLGVHAEEIIPVRPGHPLRAASAGPAAHGLHLPDELVRRALHGLRADPPTGRTKWLDLVPHSNLYHGERLLIIESPGESRP